MWNIGAGKSSEDVKKSLDHCCFEVKRLVSECDVANAFGL